MQRIGFDALSFSAGNGDCCRSGDLAKEFAMTRFTALSMLFVLSVLAGCASDEPVPQAPVLSSTGVPVTSSSGTPVTSAAPAVPAPALRPGNGVVDTVSVVAAPSASAGATVGTAVPGPYRVTVRMEDGTYQTIAQDDRDFRVGDRVQITNDGRILRR
jgi:hypothetical protein